MLELSGVNAGFFWARRFSVIAFSAMLLASLSACSTLPISGPTGSQVFAANKDARSPLKFTLVELTDLSMLPAGPALPPVENPVTPPPPTDLIGPDDVLDISIYEAGVTLFAGGGGRETSAGGAATGATGATAERLPLVRVDDDGLIQLPYSGKMRAAGHTPGELAAMIRKSLHGMSQDPQVVVGIHESIANSVIVGGEVARPGRLVLSTNRELLSDTVALAGGYRGDAKDLIVRVVRSGRPLEYRLSDVLSGPERDMLVAPGDRIEVLRQPYTFSVMGAAAKVDRLAFGTDSETLADAVAMAGGANPYLGDAKAIFVFRFQHRADGSDIPIVYHLNMMHAGAFFISQRFVMRDKDLLYIGNSASNQPSKLIQLISQLFSPIVGVETGLVGTGVIK
jgi:polysaccharide export outer membrane protein